jgi:hypothetical protein
MLAASKMIGQVHVAVAVDLQLKSESRSVNVHFVPGDVSNVCR